MADKPSLDTRSIDSDGQASSLEHEPATVSQLAAAPPALDYKYAFALDPTRCQPSGFTDRDPLWYLPRIHE